MKFKLTSAFGEVSPIRNWQPHTGIDLAMPDNTTLRSLKEGVVEKIYTGEGSLGKGISIRFEDGTTGIYGHLNEVKVKVGEHVNAGEVIGLSGNTGNSTGSHLHFALKENGEYVDPAPIAVQLASISGDGVSQGILTKLIVKSTEGVRETAKENTKEIVIGVLEGLRDLIVESIGAIALIGGGVLILLRIGGYKDGTKWFGMLQVANVLLKFFFGVY
ncbi:M23 family metallopeptidase [Bacillus sp. JJ1533]|uniref:M23 family metallopeptidase n=1 Tax=Bacillus sp. JJ1533 TaxID=3122959 RepID=UPI002FFE5F57